MHLLRCHETGGAIGAFGRVVQVPFPVWDFAVAVIAHPHEQEDQQPKYHKADPNPIQVIRKIGDCLETGCRMRGWHLWGTAIARRVTSGSPDAIVSDKLSDIAACI